MMEGKEISLWEMLEAREERVRLQQALLKRHGCPVMCFTMNIPGPVKDTPLIRRGFREGLRLFGQAEKIICCDVIIKMVVLVLLNNFNKKSLTFIKTCNII